MQTTRCDAYTISDGIYPQIRQFGVIHHNFRKGQYVAYRGSTVSYGGHSRCGLSHLEHPVSGQFVARRILGVTIWGKLILPHPVRY